MKASIVIPNLNGAGWLRDSIESVWAQTEQDFELIIIDIQNHLLGHKADGSAVHAGQLFNGIFNFGGAVCTINFDFEFLLHDNISFGFMINIF